MAITINTASQNAFLDNFLTVFNSGVMEIRSGTQPANANAAATGTVLATIALPATAFNTSAAGTAALSASVQDAAADATGVATWCRIYDAAPGTETCVIDGDVNTAGAFLNLDNVSLQLGGQVTITSLTLTHPA